MQRCNIQTNVAKISNSCATTTLNFLLFSSPPMKMLMLYLLIEGIVGRSWKLPKHKHCPNVVIANGDATKSVCIKLFLVLSRSWLNVGHIPLECRQGDQQDSRYKHKVHFKGVRILHLASKDNQLQM